MGYIPVCISCAFICLGHLQFYYTHLISLPSIAQFVVDQWAECVVVVVVAAAAASAAAVVVVVHSIVYKIMTFEDDHAAVGI